MLRLFRSALNISILLGALGAAPLFALAHFNAPLAAMLADFSERYLPNPTLLRNQANARQRAEQALSTQRSKTAAREAQRRSAGKQARATVNTRGKRILVRGAGAMLVGWVPVLGISADVVSLGEDYHDLCGVFATLDELLGLLQSNGASLYEENYCHLPQEGLDRLKEAAAEATFSWEQPANLPPDEDSQPR